MRFGKEILLRTESNTNNFEYGNVFVAIDQSTRTRLYFCTNFQRNNYNAKLCLLGRFRFCIKLITSKFLSSGYFIFVSQYHSISYKLVIN